MTDQALSQWIVILILLLCWAAAVRRRSWQGSGWAHGTARWASEHDLQRAAMLSGRGLILGRTPRRGKLIHLPKYTHVTVTAPTGAGKGVSFIITTLLTYRRRGSVFVFDPKGELFATTAAARQALGDTVYLLDPFGLCSTPGGSDCYNPLLEITPDDPRLVDECRAYAEALIVRPPEGDRDPHLNNSATILITAVIVATLLFMRPEDRNFSVVREMMSDPTLFKEVVRRLQEHGGIPARLGNSLAKQAESDKEMASVFSTASTHCSFLDSEPIAAVVNRRTFSADVLLRPGSTVYLVLPVEQLEAQRNFLRLVVSSMLRHVMRHGVRDGEVLFLLDEAASFCTGLDAVAQAFQLGRGRGIRLYTLWQSAEQAQAAFKKTPNLVSDNSDAQIFFGVNSYPTADLVSRSLGNWTMVLESANESDSGSRSSSSGPQGPTHQRSWSRSRNYAEHARALLAPSEVLQLNGDFFIAFIKGVPPLLGRRLKYFSDPLFNRSPARSRLLWWLAVAAATALLMWGAGLTHSPFR